MGAVVVLTARQAQTRRPRRSDTLCTFVLKPPRLRPNAGSDSFLGRADDTHMRAQSCCQQHGGQIRSSCMDCIRRAPRLHPTATDEPSSSCRTPLATSAKGHPNAEIQTPASIKRAGRQAGRHAVQLDDPPRRNTQWSPTLLPATARSVVRLSRGRIATTHV